MQWVRTLVARSGRSVTFQLCELGHVTLHLQICISTAAGPATLSEGVNLDGHQWHSMSFLLANDCVNGPVTQSWPLRPENNFPG